MEQGTAPTSELGRIGTGGIAPWRAWYVDETEYVPELQWPQSIPVYDRMRSDAKLAGLGRSVELPLQARSWAIEPNGAEPVSVQRLADDLDLPIVGQERAVRRRQANRFSFGAHLRLLLKALVYGHYYFEQVGDITMEEGGTLGWSLRKLAPRPPRTISEINVAEDGGLESIKQNTVGGPTAQAELIPVNRLIAYVWEYEAGNWAGRSMFRECYRNWLIKDRLLRVDAIGHERGAVGVPIAEGPPGASKEDLITLSQMMQEARITERGGGAVPSGTKVNFIGHGNNNAVIDSIRFHNEEMNNSFLAMFQNLGQSQAGGSYALGKVDYDFFGLALDAVESWVIDTFNPHMIEDWYDWNYGPDSQPARLVVEEEEPPSVELFQQGIEESDQAAEEELQPVANPAQARRSALKRAKAKRSQASQAGNEPPSLPLPTRPLRRQPYTHEVEAATDFAKIDTQLDAGVDKLSKEIKTLQAAQIAELHDQIVDAGGDLSKVGTLRPTPNAGEAILSAMQDSAAMGADEAVSEAIRQGVSSPTKADLTELNKRLVARAQAVDGLLADGLGQAAGRQMVRLSGGGMTAAEVADATAEHLRNLSGNYLEQQANGALTSAMNDGRLTTMRRNNPKSLYASELLDTNTCENCVAIDGTEYANPIDASADYPTGGYFDCLGMERCRGTLVAVYDES